MEESMKKVMFLLVVILMGAHLSGCATHVARLKDSGSVYSMPELSGSKKIVVSDLTDNRADKKKVGMISLLSLESEKPINVVLTDRIASKLRDKGFNVEKAGFLASSGKEGADFFLTGRLDNFFISSSDAILEKAKGAATFQIRIYDSAKKIIFDKNFSSIAEHWIGLTGQWGSEKIIEDTLEASVKELFQDEEFQRLLKRDVV
jgi:uncharacterized lipoprotein YajG